MTITEWIISAILMFLLALMLDMALVGMTPAEFVENIKCWIGG